MTNYDVYREFGSGITQEELDAAVERSGEAIETMRMEGQIISYLGSDVFVDEDDRIKATICRYDAESVEQVENHSEEAELPFDIVFMRGTPVPGTAPRAGVAAKPV